MKYWLFLVLFISILSAKSQPVDYSSYPVYAGNDLGLTYSPAQSAFRVWSPPASDMQLILYAAGLGGNPVSVIAMKKSIAGTWVTTVQGDHKGKFYVFRAKIDGKWMDEVPDPYAKLVGANGKRAMVGSLPETNPSGWSTDKSPVFKNKTDAIIYELHVRDASIHQSSGIKAKGKFKGLTEKGTHTGTGQSTGLDHLKELGVTHIHLLPVYDFYTVDETALNKKQYNWGYDPLNYNTPEGSYSTDPYNGSRRIREFKKLIQAFHQNGLRVVMDVVYNHTMFTQNSYFNQLVPGYYYRQKTDGSFSNATACGNETASERPMMRKFIVESVLYWVKEYHVDGFRIDLMGVHDIETMNLLSKELHKIKPDILLYGEGWTAGESPLPDSIRAIKKNAYRLNNIAVFSDDLRDGIKGSVFEHTDRGFASGKEGMEESIKFGVVAAVKHPQVNYEKVNYSRAPYAAAPLHTISYCECHDNHVLWDKLAISAKNNTAAERRQMHKLSLSIVLTAQGISFLHAGTEFLRSKQGVENSFNAGDSINAIDWNLKKINKDVFAYVKGLIQMRKQHPAFRMISAEEIATNIHFLDPVPPGVVAYTINGAAVHDKWKNILVIYNGSGQPQNIITPPVGWETYIADNKIAIASKKITGDIMIAPYSCTILYKR